MNRVERRRLERTQAKRSSPPSAAGSGTIRQDLQLAVGHHRAGRLAEAAEFYRGILNQQPDHADANNLLGVIAHQNGDYESAVVLGSKAIAADPQMAFYHGNLGNPLKQLGRPDDAEASYRKAIALKPDYVDAHFNLGNLLRELDRTQDAIASYRRAIALDPEFAKAHHGLGLVFHETGETDKAIASLRNAVGVDPQNDVFWAGLAEAISNVSFSTVDGNLFNDLLLMLDRPVVRPNAVSRPIISALKHHPDLASLLAAEGGDDYGEAAERLSQIPLLLKLMGLSVLSDIDCERMLTTLRRAMIEAEAVVELDARSLPFSAALALQCFATEYAYEESAGESAAVEALAGRLDAGGDMAPASLAALAAYRPLHDFPWAEGLTGRPWPEPIMALIKRQLSEPLEERSLRPRIPRLTAIEDKTSQEVRDQYEENPYPCWFKAGATSQPITIAQHLRSSHGAMDLRGYVCPESPEILIAGCGTGQHALLTASRYRGARVLAIDLSAASLAYAMRKTEELGVGNIEYGQADILKLGSLGRQFDLIECAGVLHHMEDPLAGWRVLAGLLRPGGLMYIGLYSEAARGPVVTVREMIAERGYGATIDGIRRCRQDIMEAVRGGDREMEKLVIWADFYSLSGCRDLLFHVREHCFTIAMIEVFLRQLDLAFLGFELSANRPALDKFKQAHGGGEALASLPLWHAFEAENPDTFSGMYQFWLRKAGQRQPDPETKKAPREPKLPGGL